MDNMLKNWYFAQDLWIIRLKIWYFAGIYEYFGKLVLLQPNWGKLDIVHPGFGFVDNYLSKMWRFNQLGKFFHWIWSIFEQKMDKFSQVRKFFTYIMVQESGLRLNIKLGFYCKSVFTVAE